MTSLLHNGLIVLVLSRVVLIHFGLKAYISEKLKALVSKQDAIDLASSIESVKVNIQELSGIAEQKRALKYKACLGARTVIDAHLSNFFSLEGAVWQAPETILARQIHNRLILSCDNPDLIVTFSEIYFGPIDGEPSSPRTVLLNEFRSMVRAELGFGKMLFSDEDRTWIARAAGDVVSRKPDYEGVE